MWQAPYYALEHYLRYLVLTPNPHTDLIFASLKIKKQKHREDKRAAEVAQGMHTRQRQEPRQPGPSAVCSLRLRALPA